MGTNRTNISSLLAIFSFKYLLLFFLFFYFFYKSIMASVKTTQNVKQEKLTQTKKYASLVASGDLYALPATAVPGCGFLLGMLLKQEGITRASELYDVYKKQKKNFPKY